jgi:hypothetical protein
MLLYISSWVYGFQAVFEECSNKCIPGPSTICRASFRVCWVVWCAGLCGVLGRVGAVYKCQLAREPWLRRRPRFRKKLPQHYNEGSGKLGVLVSAFGTGYIHTWS